MTGRNGPFGGRPALIALFAILAVCASALRSQAEDIEYRVGSQDRLRIKVSEWRPTSREVFEWSALSGEFTVSATGMLSLPVVGALNVENKTTADIATLISDRLKATAGLVTPPATAVEIAQHRPIYVVGTVERPGEYAFRPLMTALQAVSIAGGFLRSETALGRFERETIVAEGEIRVHQAQLVALLLRRDRLLAEARRADAIVFSDEIARHAGDDVTEAMREERALFASRGKAVRSQFDLLQQLRVLLEDELKTLAAKTLTQQRQQDLIKRELTNINSLLSKGLTVSPRQLAVEQNLAQSESQGLDLMLAAARSKQEISKIDRAVADLANQREIEIGRELRDAQVSLKQTADRIGALRMLVYESNVVAPRLQNQNERDLARIRLSVLRRQGGSVEELPIDETSQLRPGDVVKVERASLKSIISPLPLASSREPQN